MSLVVLSTSKNCRGGSRTAAASNMEHFVIIVNGWKPLTIITKSSILDVAAVLDSSLNCACNVISDAYLELCQTSKVEHFAKKVNGSNFEKNAPS